MQHRSEAPAAASCCRRRRRTCGGTWRRATWAPRSACTSSAPSLPPHASGAVRSAARACARVAPTGRRCWCSRAWARCAGWRWTTTVASCASWSCRAPTTTTSPASRTRRRPAHARRPLHNYFAHVAVLLNLELQAQAGPAVARSPPPSTSSSSRTSARRRRAPVRAGRPADASLQLPAARHGRARGAQDGGLRSLAQTNPGLSTRSSAPPRQARLRRRGGRRVTAAAGRGRRRRRRRRW